jgi:large subunit ribosomal protein L18
MMNKKDARLRRARQTRAKIAELKVNRLTVFRTNRTSTLRCTRRAARKCWLRLRPPRQSAQGTDWQRCNVAAATVVGKRIAEKAKAAGVETVAFDRAASASTAA